MVINGRLVTESYVNQICITFSFDSKVILNIDIHQHKNQSIFHPSNRENEIKCILVVIYKSCQTNIYLIITSFYSSLIESK